MASWSFCCLALLLVFILIHITSADCECGYSIDSTDSSEHQVFTDLLESNFLTIQNIALDTDWRIQRYHIPPRQGHIGRNCTAENAVSNPLASNTSFDGPGVNGGIPGLQLWVRGGEPQSGLVPSGEVRSKRNDMLYGSFRIAARLTDVNGTCSAMFSYYNDTQEIDIELLSREYLQHDLNDLPQSPLNLVLHSQAAQLAGFQVPNTSTYGRPIVPVDVTSGFHEYRFDWLPGKVSFFFDGAWLWDLIDPNVPCSPSALLLSHWSNGAHGWSQGPPARDAVMTISYVKAYFNSSDTQRQNDYQMRCLNPTAPNAVCLIPEQRGAPNASADNAKTQGNRAPAATAQGAQGGSAGAKTFFFVEQGNHTVNQTVYTGLSGMNRLSVRKRRLWMVGIIMLVLMPL